MISLIVACLLTRTLADSGDRGCDTRDVRPLCRAVSLLEEKTDESLRNLQATLNETKTLISDIANSIDNRIDRRFAVFYASWNAIIYSVNLSLDEQRVRMESLTSDVRSQNRSIQNLVEKFKNVTNGGWSAWSGWGQCSSTCDAGIQTRQRTCTNPRPINGGDHCFGDSAEYQLCNIVPCSVTNGGWSAWSGWGQCSATCNTGIQTRQRTCTNPRPSSGGDHCFGDSSEYQLCNRAACPVTNGGWSAWSGWGQCSATCNSGMQTRTRTCTNPRPSNGGDHCFGDSSEYQLCNTVSCPVTTGGWSAWSGWGQCSAKCNTGMQTRQRTCTNPRPSNGGDHCFGESVDYQLCNTFLCPATNGGWTSWTTWSECSRSCIKTRTRSCTNPAPSQNGLTCVGNSEENDNCDVTPCALSRLQVRLVGGSSSLNGRLEVSLNGTVWGTVCDDGFDTNDAQVACRMVGRTGSGVLINTVVPDGNGSIFLDDLACTGYESNLLYCRHSGWGVHNCNHGEDVGVSCQ